jgi:RNA-directed DNA polymerase
VSSGVSSTPSGDLGARRVAKPPPVGLASVEYIVSKASIAEAWKKVRSNKGAPGVDNISIAQFPKWGRPKWKTFKKQLLEGWR